MYDAAGGVYLIHWISNKDVKRDWPKQFADDLAQQFNKILVFVCCGLKGIVEQ